MNKWYEIIKMCIEQVEKDEVEAKKRAKMVLNSRYGLSSNFKRQDISFIIGYVSRLQTLVHTISKHDMSERLSDVIIMLKKLKDDVTDSTANIEKLPDIKNDELIFILNRIEGILWNTQHITSYDKDVDIEEVREEIRDIRCKIKNRKE